MRRSCVKYRQRSYRSTAVKASRILLLGSTGQVGWELSRSLAPLGDVVIANRSAGAAFRVDLAKPDTIVKVFDEVKPSLVVNAAAYTAVDKAEAEPDLAEAVNAIAPGIIGELAAMQGAGVIHYSTDYVFSGGMHRPYLEGDTTDPSGVYGQTKLQGELALLDACPNTLIFRTAWVYGNRGNNFLCTMQRLFKEQDELSVVDDQIGSPTWCKVIAEATAKILVQINMEPSQIGEVGGIYHLTNAGQTSWYGFARSILEASGLECALHPIPTSEYPTPAKRPAWSVLDNSKLKEAFGIILPDWKISLHHCISQQRELI